MRLKPQHCALFSVLTFAAACSDDPIAPITTGGSGGGGAGGSAGSSAGSSSAGMTSGGASAGSPTAGSTSTAGSASGGGGAGGGSAGGGAGGGGAGGMAPMAECGNGMKEGAEACDDDNTTASDGCSATCTLEAGYVCNTPVKRARPCAATA